ncbi:MAG: Vacuolar H+transporting two-sector ATPase F subunit [Planctomycetes bacterium]|nr:Vacuolar H+transporting two-sector ATPase F subunit [Planctomycetota bacterium]
MRYFVIGDEDTVLGFRLAGVQGRVVDSPGDAGQALDQALDDETIGVIIITERTVEAIRKQVEQAMFEHSSPVIVEIPDRQGPMTGRKTLMEMIRQAVGIGV